MGSAQCGPHPPLGTLGCPRPHDHQRVSGMVCIKCICLIAILNSFLGELLPGQEVGLQAQVQRSPSEVVSWLIRGYVCKSKQQLEQFK